MSHQPQPRQPQQIQSHHDLLTRLFYDPKTGFYSTPSKLHHAARLHDPSIKISDCRSFLERQKTVHLHRERRRKVESFFHISADSFGHQCQIDLIDMQRFSTKNRNFAWILCIIDVFSRKAFAYPLKRKTPHETADVFRQLLETGYLPSNVRSDQGTEFKGAFAELLQEHGIVHWLNPVGQHTSLGIVDRFCRTLKGLLWKYWSSSTRQGVWYNVLADLIHNYNNTPHRTIGTTPNQRAAAQTRVIPASVICQPRSCRTQHMSLRNPVREGMGKGHRQLKIGDMVMTRIVRKSIFRKGYEPRWSELYYRIKRRNGNSFVLEQQLVDESWQEVARSFLHRDLKKVDPNQMQERRGAAPVPVEQGAHLRRAPVPQTIIDRWLQAVSEFIPDGNVLTNVPPYLSFVGIRRINDPRRVDTYLHITDPGFPPPANRFRALRSVPDIRRYFAALIETWRQDEDLTDEQVSARLRGEL